MIKPFYKLLFIYKAKPWGLIRNQHRNFDMIIIHKERCNVLYAKYKNVDCKVILKMFLLQMWGDSQIVSP